MNDEIKKRWQLYDEMTILTNSHYKKEAEERIRIRKMTSNKKQVRQGEAQKPVPYVIVYNEKDDFGSVWVDDDLWDEVGIPMDKYSIDEAEKIVVEAIELGGYYGDNLPEDWTE